jgi:hypothetical protein
MQPIDLTPPTKPTAVTLVTFLLDRTGSMEPIKSQTIEAFNAYLATLQAERDAKIEFSLIQFDSVSVDRICAGLPVRDVPLLTTKTYVPRGLTPLIDAAMETIHAVERLIAGRKDNPRVVICIQTDGQENASTKHTWNTLRETITAKQLAGWQFNFMGAGIDAYRQASFMGVAHSHTVSYSTDSAHTHNVFVASASNTANFAAGRSSSTGYTGLQKREAGDDKPA